VKRIAFLLSWFRGAAFLLLLAPASLAQSAPSKPASPNASPRSAPAAPPAIAPDEGTFNGQLYTSDYFGFRYTIPEGLEVQEDFLQGQQDAERRSFVLLAAYGTSAHPAYQQGVVISADRNAYPAVKTAADYVAKTAREHFEPGSFEQIGAARAVTLGGHEFSRIDYRKGKIYQSLLATMWRGYVLCFHLVAPSAQAMDALAESLQSLWFPPPKPKPPVPPR